MLRNTVLLCAAMAAAASAQPVHTYGDTIIDGMLTSHRDIAALEIRSASKDGSQILLSRGAIDPAKTDVVQLRNSMGETIGFAAISFRNARHASALTIVQEISRKIYLANNLIEPDPFVPGARRSRLGQKIVDELMARNADLVTLGLHIGASGADNAILASNFGRIGKAGDKDDARVIDSGEVLKEPTNGGKRLAVSLPMLDRRGRVVGALSTSFLVGPGGSAAAEARALAIRDEIARRIASLAQLMR